MTQSTFKKNLLVIYNRSLVKPSKKNPTLVS